MPFLAHRVTRPTLSPAPNFKSIDSEVRELWVFKVGGFPLIFIVALTTVLRTTVLHCNVYVYLITITILVHCQNAKHRPNTHVTC